MFAFGHSGRLGELDMVGTDAAELLWGVDLTLGEGPLWDPRLGRLYAVDIEGRRLVWLEPGTGARVMRDLPAKPGFAALMPEPGRLLLGLATGLHGHDLDGGGLTLLAPIPDLPPGHRLNDGKVDPSGRLWFSSMAEDQREGAGVLWLWEGTGVPRRLAEGLTIPNGPAFTADGSTGYLADSPTGKVHRFDGTPEGVAGRVLFLELGEQDGHPDGMTVDAEGFLWQAHYGGSCVTRHGADGRELARVTLPVTDVTSCAFGGPDLTTLFITTAGGGGIYRAEVGARGVAAGVLGSGIG